MYGLFGINIANKTYTHYSGAGPFNSSYQEQVGRGMAALLSLTVTSSNSRASLEHYTNNFVYISSFLLTQKRPFETVKQATDTSDAVLTEKTNRRHVCRYHRGYLIAMWPHRSIGRSAVPWAMLEVRTISSLHLVYNSDLYKKSSEE